MSAPTASGIALNYPASLWAILRGSLAQLVRSPDAPRCGEALRKLTHQLLPLVAIGAVVIPALMFGFDILEITWMPARGTPGLWPVRILTDFGQDGYVLGLLAAMLLAVAIICPTLRAGARTRLLDWGTRLQFLLFAVLLPVLAGEVVKWIAGRGRPFVGGKANAFNFVPFAGTEAHASLPSAHAITAFALAFAVAALWPRARTAMAVYAALIALSRLVLLAHHPSDVVTGALIGVIGAMLVRYWFAARGLCFAIQGNGGIVPLSGSLRDPRKGVAREASAP